MLGVHRLCSVFTPLVVTPSHCLDLGSGKGGLGTLHKGEVCKGRQIFHPFLGLSQVHLKYIQSTPEVHLKLHCISMSEVRLCTSDILKFHTRSDQKGHSTVHSNAMPVTRSTPDLLVAFLFSSYIMSCALLFK